MIGYYVTTTGTYENWPVDGTASNVVFVPTYSVHYTSAYDPCPFSDPNLTKAAAKAQANRHRMASFLASLTPSYAELRRPAPSPPPLPDRRQMVHKKRCFSRCGSRRPRVRSL